jgi:integral membrane protein (TIGR01906 family)
MFWAERFSDFENSAVNRVELIQAAEAGLIFVSGGGDYMPHGDDYRTSFTSDVIYHMQDVRDVFHTVRVVVATLAVIVAMQIFYLISRNDQVNAGRTLNQAAFFTTVITLCFVAYGWLNFDSLFNRMHQLLFAEGTWLFQSNSLLITAYPFEFWIAMAASWAVTIFALCLLVMSFGHNMTMHGYQRKNSVKPNN